jgi:hypothetical protein
MPRAGGKRNVCFPSSSLFLRSSYQSRWRNLHIPRAPNLLKAFHMTEAEIDQLTERIIGCGIEVHRTFGAGLLESVYRECMAIELRTAQLRFETERQIKLKVQGNSARQSSAARPVGGGHNCCRIESCGMSSVEFDGRIAAVAREESNDTGKTQKRRDRLACAFDSSHARLRRELDA